MMCADDHDETFTQQLRRYASGFFTNLDQPEMSFGEKWSKFFSNRSKAALHGCCGNHGEPGC